MGQGLSQYNIPERQLQASSAQPRVDVWTDIGEAKIVHTIFGRAKVRVIREQDKKRRAWLLAALAVVAIAAGWQGWSAYQRVQSAAPPLSLNDSIRVSAPAPVFQSVDTPPPATPPMLVSKPGMLPQTEINKPVTSQKSAQFQQPGLKGTGQMAAKPVTAQPLLANKPQTAPLATNNNALKNQTVMQQPPKPSVPIQPVAPMVATPPVLQPAASKPAAIAPLVEPLIKRDTSTHSPAGANQPPATVNVQP